MPGSRDDEPLVSVHVTDAARSYLAEQLEQHASRTTCFRLKTGADRKTSTTVDEPSPGDVLVRHRNRIVLAVEPALATNLQGNTIDIEQTDDGRKALIVL